MVGSQGDLLVAYADCGVRRVLAEALAMAGYAVRTVADGAAALEAVTRHPPRLLLLGMCLPFLDGRGVARGLQERCVAVPILVLSVENSQAAAKQIGAQGGLTLPCDVEELLWAVETLAGLGPRGALAAGAGIVEGWLPRPEEERVGPVSVLQARNAARLQPAEAQGFNDAQRQLERRLQLITRQAEALPNVSTGPEVELTAAAMARLLQQATEAVCRLQEAMAQILASGMFSHG